MSTREGGMWIISESIKGSFPKISDEVLERVLSNYDKMVDHYYQFQAHTPFDEQIKKMTDQLANLTEDSSKDDFFESLILLQLFVANIRLKRLDKNW